MKLIQRTAAGEDIVLVRKTTTGTVNKADTVKEVVNEVENEVENDLVTTDAAVEAEAEMVTIITIVIVAAEDKSVITITTNLIAKISNTDPNPDPEQGLITR